jgi:hypothetical protein
LYLGKFFLERTGEPKQRKGTMWAKWEMINWLQRSGVVPNQSVPTQSIGMSGDLNWFNWLPRSGVVTTISLSNIENWNGRGT